MIKRTLGRLGAAVVLAVCLVGAWAAAALATGSAAGDSVTNGYFAKSDTVPQSAGRLAIAFTPVNLPTDTLFSGPSATVSHTIDTGYDLAAINSPADSNIVRARDTVSYAYVITNRGNATLTMDVSAAFSSVGSDTNWGSSAYKVFNDANNDGMWSSGDAVITTLTLAADATDTIVVAVLVPNTAVDDDSSGARFFVTDRAPIVSPSVTGDLWENGAPILGNDSYDTQVDTVVTRVIGPNIRVTKTQSLASGRARPGDTIVYAITIDNDGGDSASNVVVYDAIPSNAVFVPNSADSSELNGSSQTAIVSYDSSSLGAATFNDTGSTAVKVIRWNLTQPLGVTSGDDRTTVDFSSNNDAARVYYKVRIQ